MGEGQDLAGRSRSAHSEISAQSPVSPAKAWPPARDCVVSLRPSARSPTIWRAVLPNLVFQYWLTAWGNSRPLGEAFCCQPTARDLALPSSRGDGPYNTAGAAFSTSENGPLPSSRETTGPPSASHHRVVSAKTSAKRRCETTRCTCPEDAGTSSAAADSLQQRPAAKSSSSTSYAIT